MAAGALIKQGAEVTMNNLMTAYNSINISTDCSPIPDELSTFFNVFGVTNPPFAINNAL